jgi:hypothetical protein
MKNKFYVFLILILILLSVSVKAQITFKLKSVVGQQNPSANGLFNYGTLNGGNYGEDGTNGINGIAQKGWTFVLGEEHYPFFSL